MRFSQRVRCSLTIRRSLLITWETMGTSMYIYSSETTFLSIAMYCCKSQNSCQDGSTASTKPGCYIADRPSIRDIHPLKELPWGMSGLISPASHCSPSLLCLAKHRPVSHHTETCQRHLRRLRMYDNIQAPTAACDTIVFVVSTLSANEETIY